MRDLTRAERKQTYRVFRGHLSRHDRYGQHCPNGEPRQITVGILRAARDQDPWRPKRGGLHRADGDTQVIPAVSDA